MLPAFQPTPARRRGHSSAHAPNPTHSSKAPLRSQPRRGPGEERAAGSIAAVWRVRRAALPSPLALNPYASDALYGVVAPVAGVAGAATSLARACVPRPVPAAVYQPRRRAAPPTPAPAP
eukprot:357165-Chlamydomonas_euryale.AAC.2